MIIFNTHKSNGSWTLSYSVNKTAINVKTRVIFIKQCGDNILTFVFSKMVKVKVKVKLSLRLTN
jgi:hypothetical protein